jgi:hypothetical protein
VSQEFEDITCWHRFGASDEECPNFGSAAKDITALMIWDIFLTVPLLGGNSTSLDMKK